jgi:hypothetical protein
MYAVLVVLIVVCSLCCMKMSGDFGHATGVEQYYDMASMLCLVRPYDGQCYAH